jgi:dTDP-4-amino-4,6-dideoxy-D-galactose acyltransferase
MPANHLLPLNWDTNFFGYEVAQVIFDQFGDNFLENLLRDIKFKNIRLTYFFASPLDLKLNEHIEKIGGILVDQKTVYAKTTHAHVAFSNHITEYGEVTPSERLVELGLQAGIFSRFNTDKNFNNHEFERLYKEWLVNSVNKKIAFKTLISLSGSEITGLTTMGKKDNYADIGLVAVDQSYRGKGIGTDLIKFADNIAFELKFETIKVVTQLQNRGACRLYEKCNFKIDRITNVYHYWQ